MRRPMKDTLTAVPEIADKLYEAYIDAVLDPSAYTGLCAAFVDRVLGSAGCNRIWEVVTLIYC